MITMQQALAGQEFHEDHAPAGKIYTWRRNGATQTWKTRPGEFRIPVKYGVRAKDQDQLWHYDAHRFHVPEECPARSFTVTCVSVRCATDPATGQPYEDPAGGPFGSVAEAQQHVRESMRDLTVYWRVYLYDATGTRAMRGTRSDTGGGHANGKRWIWEAVTSAPESGTLTCPVHGYQGYAPACSQCWRDQPES